MDLFEQSQPKEEPVIKRGWMVHVPGYPPFQMIMDDVSDYQRALEAARLIWPQADVS